jgi:hypothetical protein
MADVPGTQSGVASWCEAVPDELTVQYVVGAYLAMLTWWLDAGAQMPLEQLNASFRHLVTRGIGERL